ncbi:MAG TPA: GntR family transcriptional regulator, partial [Ktedonobacteraceae bacterium]|nr:GntR family transcriptional regulator [Ktedonobacteraceae bacterium]
MRYTESSRETLPLFTVPVHSFIKLERTNGVPLYQQICRGLREAILSGELAEGTRLPTERALAHDLGINRTTVMNAYHELASEGLIEGHVGRGTIVKRSYFNYDDENDLEQDIPTWLLGLAAGEDAILGPDARVLSEISTLGERKEIISLAAGTPAPDLLPAELVRAIVDDGLLNARQSAL